MKVTLDLDKKICKVIKEKGDLHFKHSGWTSAESTFLYHVLQCLKKQGYDLIKKRMHKDGHMVCDHQQYIRSRCLKNNPFCIFNNEYAISDIGLEFNGIFDGDEIKLTVISL